MPKILQVENLTVVLDGLTIIENLSFELEKGENLAVIGPNGSGKTVLLKTLLGFFPHKGEIKWTEGVKLGYVPQKIDADRHLPIDLENLLSAKANVLGIGKFEIKTAIEATKITEKILKTSIGHLSGGLRASRQAERNTSRRTDGEHRPTRRRAGLRTYPRTSGQIWHNDNSCLARPRRSLQVRHGSSLPE